MEHTCIIIDHLSVGYCHCPHLVGGFQHGLFSRIYGIVLPIDFHIFRYGYCTTNQVILVNISISQHLDSKQIKDFNGISWTFSGILLGSEWDLLKTPIQTSPIFWGAQHFHRRTRIPLDADEPIPEATENTWKSKARQELKPSSPAINIGILWVDWEVGRIYHLVNIHKTMENHHVSWENPLFRLGHFQ